mmetsp:Transcript_23458/g.58328  ORF Transcript_23458/g.58328 Transcript_23458/m.58328 type:complete len:1096 (-) Transcript_23458:266-3553(-)
MHFDGRVVQAASDGALPPSVDPHVAPSGQQPSLVRLADSSMHLDESNSTAQVSEPPVASQIMDQVHGSHECEDHLAIVSPGDLFSCVPRRTRSGDTDSEQRRNRLLRHVSSRSLPSRLCFVRYDPCAFSTGDSILGAWRQTDVDLPLRARTLIRSLSKSRYAVERPTSRESTGSENPGAPAGATVGSLSMSKSWHFRGMRSRNPWFHQMLAKRVGTRTSLCLVMSFVVFEGMRFVLAEHAYVSGVNAQSISVVANGASLVIAMTASFVLEGSQAWRKVFSLHPLWRFLSVAVLFACARTLSLLALRTGATSAQIATVGYVYMPIAAVLSYYVFQRHYGMLEWLAMGMMTLAILTFVFLREQSKGSTPLEMERIRSEYSFPGLVLILCSVMMSVIGSILAERLFKDRSKGLKKWWAARFYVMKVHLDFGLFVITGAMWALPLLMRDNIGSLTGAILPVRQVWFGDWSWQQYLMVVVLVGQNWLAGLLVKEFSTVMRALTQSITLMLIMCVEDPILGNRYHFQAREIPTVVLACITCLSAVIFQTGRLNVRIFQEAASLGLGECPTFRDKKRTGESLGAAQDSSSSLSSSLDGGGAGAAVAEPCEGRAEEGQLGGSGVSDGQLSAPEGEGEPATKKSALPGMSSLLCTYSLLLVYTLFDAVRNLILQRAMASTVINANSMGFVQYACGVAVASGLTLYTDKWDGIVKAFTPRKIMKCMPAGFLFAVQATLMNMAYSQGISAALALILGRVYIPVVAFGARFVRGNVYMWIEYLAICILTLATVAFGYLKAFDITTGTPQFHHFPAMVLVMASATTAAMNSLITESLLKTENVPFHLQKIRLDVASMASSMVLLPVIGAITDRVENIPWIERPVSRDCKNAFCWDLDAGAGGNPRCDCECASGMFAGWTASSMIMIMLALVIGVAYNWLVGKLVQRFSTIHRCIADSFSLLLIYFVGDPVLNHTNLSNMCLNLVAFIVPLSSGLFAVAASEMKWVLEAASLLQGNPRGNAATSDSGTCEAIAPYKDDHNGESADDGEDDDMESMMTHMSEEEDAEGGSAGRRAAGSSERTRESGCFTVRSAPAALTADGEVVLRRFNF